MKRILATAVVLLFACSPKTENAHIQLRSFGPLTKDGLIYWAIVGKAKSPLSSLILKSDSLKTEFLNVSAQPAGEFSFIVEPKSASDFLWLFDAGSTSFPLSVISTDQSGGREELTFPVSFSESSKAVTRQPANLFMNRAPDDPVELPFLIRDSRKWTKRICGFMDEITFACEYTHGEVKSGQPAELYRYTLSKDPNKTDLGRVLGIVESNFRSKNCRNFSWHVVSSTPTEIIYEWSHDGCGNFPQTHEIARTVRKPGIIKSSAYVKYGPRLGPTDFDRMLAILRSEQ